MNSRHHLRWILAALAFGALALPALVYATGIRVLGPYAGGVAAFYGNFAADLAALRPAAWTLALGPAVIAAGWRVIVAWARRGD
ncbi:MAG: hypothetical protein U1F08_14240 [Steroidobacteraceae bacterium]